MANFEGQSSIRNVMFNGKSSLLPPKSPFPSLSPSYIEYTPSFGHKGIPKPREGNSHHQRTSSESFLIEEQPSWLDDLLNEPDTPVRRGHRRSSSDSFTYYDAPNVANLDFIVQDHNNFRNMMPIRSWGSQEFDYHGDAHHTAFYGDHNSSNRHKNRTRDASPNKIMHPHGIPSPKENLIVQSSGSPCPPQGDRAQSPAIDKQDLLESGPPDPNSSAEKRDSLVKNSSSGTDKKYSRQQFAQRSRVRKLQYIAELERNVQALQAEGSEVSAELEFLNQQNLIMNMENKALKQRLESLTQEKLLKYVEHELLEKERERLQALYQQQQQPQPQQQQKQQSHGHRHTTSRDLDQQFKNLSFEK
nr:uncharacterized protein At4g06598-like [Ipomoea batatas]GMD10108.1 uncharacterized protein At4g06598-like [Ipomoea batatas]